MKRCTIKHLTFTR